MQRNDFIELLFSAKIKDTGEVFDTNIADVARAAKLDSKCRPLRLCIGQGMVISGLDKALEGKEPGKKYSVVLKPQEAFGPRSSKLIRTISLDAFKEKPHVGMLYSFDGLLGRIISVSGGRVTVDFNSPLAGKTIEYEFEITRKITDAEEKLLVLAEQLTKEEQISVSGNVVFVEIMPSPERCALFKSKAKELLGIDAEIKEKKS